MLRTLCATRDCPNAVGTVYSAMHIDQGSENAAAWLAPVRSSTSNGTSEVQAIQASAPT